MFNLLGSGLGRRWRPIVVAAAMVAVSTGGIAHPGDPALRALAAGPCDDVVGSPGPPGGPGEPDISGHIVDGSTSLGIEGATVRLYRCDGTTPTLVATDTTSASGGYAFLDLDAPEWYVVEAVMTGPLSTRAPADGTVNPTAPIDVGPGQDEVNLEFE